jgi:hypothetical protein
MRWQAGTFLLLAGLGGCTGMDQDPYGSAPKFAQERSPFALATLQRPTTAQGPALAPTTWSGSDGSRTTAALAQATAGPGPMLPPAVETAKAAPPPVPPPVSTAQAAPPPALPTLPALPAGTQYPASGPKSGTPAKPATAVAQASHEEPADDDDDLADEPKEDGSAKKPCVNNVAKPLTKPLPSVCTKAAEAPEACKAETIESPKAEPAKGESADATKPGAGHGAPLVRMVNTKRITLNFEVKDVGPSGVSAVELWYTQDCKQWKKYDAPPKAHSYVIEVDEEGMYGFTLLARSGIGLGHEPPRSGDVPQVWVVVDLTKPVVELNEVTPGIDYKNQTVKIRWTASDKNLGRNPICLSYAEKAGGEWKLIAENLKNTGEYIWQVPKTTPTRFLVRVEATDLAGNVGFAEAKQHALLDPSRPSVWILNVEPSVSK